MKKIKTLIRKRYQLLHRKSIMMLPLLSSIIICSVPDAIAQDIKYRRSSLSMMLIESDNFPNKDAVLSSWKNFPFPDKYNKHDLDIKSVDINNITITDEDMRKSGYLKDTLKNIIKLKGAETLYNSLSGNSTTKSSAQPLRYLNAEKSMAVLLPSEKQEFQVKLDKIIREGKLGNKMIARWFNRSKDGKFDMSVISERGFYNASEMDANIAKGSAKGNASLSDAGIELINNTFITFTKLDFYSNEPVAALIRDAAKAKINSEMASMPAIVVNKALKGVDAVYEKTKEGYSLVSKTWLYKLKWNDSIANVFYADLWNNPVAFDNSKLFELEFVGNQYNFSLVTFKLGETRTQEQIIDLALVRNVDNAFSTLQKEYDVFKPKVPVYSTDPIISQIGMKEGLKGGEKFQVLEQTINAKTGLTEYVKVGTVKADKKQIWDNRYNAGGKPETEQLDKDGKPITGTRFKGSKKIQQGMLMKQIK